MDVAASWDEEYRSGRYSGEGPLPFVDDIVAAVRAAQPPPGGVYIGCGNGRNYVPLLDAGLDLVGLDISAAALEQLRARAPGARLVHGTLGDVEGRFGIVVALQVFQHGTAGEAHAQIRAAIARLLPGGLFCVRVNAVGTQIEHAHTVVGQNTIRYDAGPKRGLVIHFFERAELEALTHGLEPVLSPRIARTPRQDGTHWDQWEAIWRCA